MHNSPSEASISILLMYCRTKVFISHDTGRGMSQPRLEVRPFFLLCPQSICGELLLSTAAFQASFGLLYLLQVSIIDLISTVFNAPIPLMEKFKNFSFTNRWNAGASFLTLASNAASNRFIKATRHEGRFLPNSCYIMCLLSNGCGGAVSFFVLRRSGPVSLRCARAPDECSLRFEIRRNYLARLRKRQEFFRRLALV